MKRHAIFIFVCWLFNGCASKSLYDHSMGRIESTRATAINYASGVLFANGNVELCMGKNDEKGEITSYVIKLPSWKLKKESKKIDQIRQYPGLIVRPSGVNKPCGNYKEGTNLPLIARVNNDPSQEEMEYIKSRSMPGFIVETSWHSAYLGYLWIPELNNEHIIGLYYFVFDERKDACLPCLVFFPVAVAVDVITAPIQIGIYVWASSQAGGH